MQQLFIDFPWMWVIVATVFSQASGALWYSKTLFGEAYGKAIGMSMWEKENKPPKNMSTLLLVETISRFVFFGALWLLLQYIWADHRRTIGILYFMAVITTIVTSVTWSSHRPSLVCITWWKLLLDLLVGLLIYGYLS